MPICGCLAGIPECSAGFSTPIEKRPGDYKCWQVHVDLEIGSVVPTWKGKNSSTKNLTCECG